MKVLSIKQPRASLILAGIKTIETRSQVTHVRGTIAIHASLQYAKTDEGMENWLDDNKIHFLPRIKRSVYNKDLAPTGVILGFVDLVDCIPAFDWTEKQRKNGPAFIHYQREWALGDLSSDRYAWILERPRLLSAPIAARGRLGFWEYSALGNL